MKKKFYVITLICASSFIYAADSGPKKALPALRTHNDSDSDEEQPRTRRSRSSHRSRSGSPTETDLRLLAVMGDDRAKYELAGRAVVRLFKDPTVQAGISYVGEKIHAAASAALDSLQGDAPSTKTFLTPGELVRLEQDGWDPITSSDVRECPAPGIVAASFERLTKREKRREVPTSLTPQSTPDELPEDEPPAYTATKPASEDQPRKT